jgi:2-keto-3-deoxy-L-rhamnonate aldolase RhmA
MRNAMKAPDSNLRERVRKGEMLLGTFLKTASHQTVELLGQVGLDFLVVDAEHAPFDRSDLDRILLAARGVDLPCLVRVLTVSDGTVGACLDLGSIGIVVPHVSSESAARAAVAAAKYRGGIRGFSPSTRAAAYGDTKNADHLLQSDRSIGVWCQIEDAAALEVLDEIASAPEVDCLFVGRADLAVSLGVDGPQAPVVREAVAAIAAAGRRYKVAVGIHVADVTEIDDFRSLGISVFICGSDQSWLLRHARHVRSEFDMRCKDRQQERR